MIFLFFSGAKFKKNKIIIVMKAAESHWLSGVFALQASFHVWGVIK